MTSFLSSFRSALFLFLVFALLAPSLPAEETGDLRVLVFSKTAGFRHGSIEPGIEAMKKLGRENGFAVEATEDSSHFNSENLSRFQTVVFLNTTGPVFNDEQKAAFKKYIQGGGGFVGVHAASDTHYDWEWYGKLVGAYFRSHPAVQEAVIHVEDHRHPSTRGLPAEWVRVDEWYNFRENPRGNVHVLMTLDVDSFDGSQMRDDHPIAWYHEYDGGRAFYTAGGHTNESFSEKEFLAHLLGAILWSAGKAEIDASK